MEDDSLIFIVDQKFIKKITNDSLSNSNILGLKTKPLKLLNLYSISQIYTLKNYLVRNNIKCTKGIYISEDREFLTTDKYFLLDNELKKYFLFNNLNKTNLLYFSLNNLDLKYTDILKYIEFSLVDNYVLKYLDLSKINYLENVCHELILKLIATSLKNNTSIELINLTINLISPNFYSYLELFLKNKINIKFIYLDIYTINDSIMEYLVNGLQNPIKDKLHSFVFYIRSKKKCNIEQLYSFFENNFDKLLDLSVIKINISEYNNINYKQMFNNMELCLKNLKNLEIYDCSLNYFHKSFLINLLKDNIKSLEICVDLNNLDKYDIVYNLAKKYQHKDVKYYKLRIDNQIFKDSYYQDFNIECYLIKKNANDFLYSSTENKFYCNEIPINTQFIEFIPGKSLIKVNIELININENEYNKLLDKFISNGNTLKYIKVKIINNNKQLFNHFDKFILFIKSAKFLEVLNLYLENVVFDKLDLLITLLIFTYCQNIKHIKLEIYNKNIINNNEYLTSICSSIDNIVDIENFKALNTIDYLLQILNNYYVKTNNINSNIFDRNTIIQKLKQRNIETIFINSLNRYNLILLLWIKIYINSNYEFYNIHSINHDDNLSIKEKTNYDSFDYFKELNTCCYLHKSYNNYNYNSLTSYKMMSSSPYFIGYLKVVSSLYINMSDIFENNDNYLEHYDIISMLQNKAIIKSLIINNNIYNYDSITKFDFQKNLYERVFNFKNLNYLLIIFDFDIDIAIEDVFHILKSVATNYVYLREFCIEFENIEFSKYVILSVLNRFSICINSINISYKTFKRISFNNYIEFYDLNTLDIKLIILLTNKKNIKYLNIPLHLNNKILKYLFKSFNKKSTLTLLKKNLFLYKNNSSKEINMQNKKLLFKFCRYNKLNNYIISYESLIEC